MPGYPAFIACCGGSVRAVRAAQSVIDVSTLLAVFLLAARISKSPGVGVIAAAVMALNPFYVYFSSLILTETIFTALLAWAIWFLVSGRWKLSLVFLIAGCYIKPTGLLFLPLLLCANSTAPVAYRLSDVLRRLAITTFFTLVCLFPWAWRNHQMLGQWVWTTTNAGVTLYDGFNPAADGSSNQRFVTQLSGLKSINEVERSRYFSAAAKDWIRKNLSDIPALSVKKILRGWSPVPLSAEFGRPVYRWISAAYALPFDLLCLIGLFSRRILRREKWLLIAPALIVTLAQVLSVGSIRYRMPAEATMAVLVAVGVSTLVDRKVGTKN
jgi:4-amino-4-deoxy-L-arabinose transferase-like glycosyltransferase